MGPLGELGALFNPGMRHELEERRSKEMRREEEGTGRKGHLRIDLESGVAVIQSKRAGADADGAAAGDGEVPSDESGDRAHASPARRPAPSANGTSTRSAPSGATPTGTTSSGTTSSRTTPSGKARRRAPGARGGQSKAADSTAANPKTGSTPATSAAPTPAGKSRRGR